MRDGPCRLDRPSLASQRVAAPIANQVPEGICAAVHFLEGADLNDRFGSANLPGGVLGNRLGRGRAMSGRWVTLPV